MIYCNDFFAECQELKLHRADVLYLLEYMHERTLAHSKGLAFCVLDCDRYMARLAGKSKLI